MTNVTLGAVVANIDNVPEPFRMEPVHRMLGIARRRYGLVPNDRPVRESW